MSALDRACPPIPPESTTRTRSRPRRRRRRRRGPQAGPDDHEVERLLLDSSGARRGAAISAFVGSLSAVPSGSTMSGRRSQARPARSAVVPRRRSRQAGPAPLHARSPSVRGGARVSRGEPAAGQGAAHAPTRAGSLRWPRGRPRPAASRARGRNGRRGRGPSPGGSPRLDRRLPRRAAGRGAHAWPADGEGAPRRRRRRGRAGRRPAGEYQGDVRVLLGEPIEQPKPHGIRDALDPVAPGVALDELSLDPIEELRVLVDGDDDGERHPATLLDLGWPSLSGAHRAPRKPNRATQCRMPLSGEAAVTHSGYRRRVDRRDEHVAWLVGSIGFAGIAVMLAIDVLLFQIV